MKKYIYILIGLFLLSSCGARKSSVNKSETTKEVKENVVTNTREEITETVTRVIDTVIKVPEAVTETEKPLDEVMNGQPMVYEDENIKSETYYDRETGSLRNKTTQKAKDIPVKQKEVTQREIKRNTDEHRNISTTEKTKTKAKDTERKQSFAWVFWVIGILAAAWFIMLIGRRTGKG